MNQIVENRKLCEYFLALCVILCWIPGMLEVIPVLDELVNHILQEKLFVFIPMGYVGYFALGYFIYTHGVSRKQHLLISATGLLGVLYGVVGGVLYGRHIGEPSQATYNNLTLNIACYSAMIFVFFKDMVGSIQFTEKAKKSIYKLGSSTLGIYLVHVMFVQAFSDRFMAATNYRYPFASILIAFLIFVCGYIVTNVVRKIPFVGKWIV